MPKKLQDILKTDYRKVNKGTIKEFKEDLRHLINVADQRIAKLKNTEYYTVNPSFLSLSESQRNKILNGKSPFAIRDANDVNMLQSDFADVKRFLMNKTSTVSGWNRMQEKMTKVLNGETGKNTQIDFDSDSYKNFWSAIDELRNSKETNFSSLYKPKFLSSLYTAYYESGGSKSFEEAYHKIRDMVDDMYESTVTPKELGFKN